VRQGRSSEDSAVLGWVWDDGVGGGDPQSPTSPLPGRLIRRFETRDRRLDDLPRSRVDSLQRQFVGGQRAYPANGGGVLRQGGAFGRGDAVGVGAPLRGAGARTATSTGGITAGLIHAVSGLTCSALLAPGRWVATSGQSLAPGRAWPYHPRRRHARPPL